jgi:lipopolysaccharide/colanic/teichoic acid biosynthesis glycosyltransferase
MVHAIKKSTFYEISKRIMDIVFSVFLFILFLPIFILTAIAIKLESRGPVFADTPSRVGKNGKTFKMYKFRSMVENAHHILREDPRYAKLYNTYKKSSYKLRHDPRTTKVGKLIRKYSLDELPQFLNVLKGEMSLVGPRAYYSDELEGQQSEYPHTRNAVKIVLSVRPGITGFWQVSGRSEINFDKRIEMDAAYVRKRSILYDLWIILKSPWAMLSGKGV